MARLRKAAEQRGVKLPAFASDAALLLAEATDELAEALRLDQQERLAGEVRQTAENIRALAPILAAL
jgi:hypothetical protein